MAIKRFVTRGKYLRRLRLASWLAWHAIRGNTFELEWGDDYTTVRAIGVTLKNDQ